MGARHLTRAFLNFSTGFEARVFEQAAACLRPPVVEVKDSTLRLCLTRQALKDPDGLTDEEAKRPA